MAWFDALDLGFAPWARRRCFTFGEAKVSSKSRCQDVVVVEIVAFGGLLDVLRGSQWRRWKERERERDRLSGAENVSEASTNLFYHV